MGIKQSLAELITSFLPMLIIVVFFAILLFSIYKFFIGNRTELGSEKLFPRQLILIGLTLVAAIGVALSLPVGESSRSQIIGLIGLVVSGALAFSSSTIFSNLMAGILLRITKPFRIGNFISVRDHFGRVTERGLFHTEIQSENRELITIPNSYLMLSAVSTVPNSDAIVSTTLSLGYSTHHSRVRPLLEKAATESGLTAPFVHIIELGNYSITYRISGVLAEAKGLITTKSNLHQNILDVLHHEDIEIMSPTYINQRQTKSANREIPEQVIDVTRTKPVAAEDIVFDKAEKVLQLEGKKIHLLESIERVEDELKSVKGEEKDRLVNRLNDMRKQLDIIKQEVRIQLDDEQPKL